MVKSKVVVEEHTDGTLTLSTAPSGSSKKVYRRIKRVRKFLKKHQMLHKYSPTVTKEGG